MTTWKKGKLERIRSSNMEETKVFLKLLSFVAPRVSDTRNQTKNMIVNNFSTAIKAVIGILVEKTRLVF